jgi:superfamily II DNA or RNA helicase
MVDSSVSRRFPLFHLKIGRSLTQFTITRSHEARGTATMTHPLFRKEIFIETAFERRFQAMLRSAWHKRSWHVIVADPGSGKTMGIRDMIKTAGSRTVLAVVAPKNNEEEQALGDQLYTALGLPRRRTLAHSQAQTHGTPSSIWDPMPDCG